ncbi:cysteine synthase A [Fusobacterium sp. IOR10]|uniref:cysteine synthase A n=1 Tax=Fusobacterium sp. IOR10 TaxID=2665157 RepID=UPI0013D5A4C4|nr:cysteine synthase A [Fusobacterium sp. IOR10]
MIVKNVLELIGNTPILKLNNMCGSSYCQTEMADIYIKLEGRNPGGSTKDRIALNMIQRAEESGRLKINGTIIEPTSGNTGIGLVYIGKLKGYRVVIVMPDTMSEERINIMKAYGGEVVLTDGKLGMKGAIAKAEELAKTIENSFIPGQFDNIANPQAHYNNTAEEIIKDFDDLDAFVAGVGTGGTLIGNGKRLKKEFENIKLYAVEPSKSPVLSGGKPGPHGIQGIGAGFIPEVMDVSIMDHVIKVKDEDAFETCRQVAKEEGILFGISTGANIYAAIEVAKKLGPGKKVLTISPDGGEKYLSTDLYKY